MTFDPPGKVPELAHTHHVTAAIVKPREREVLVVITSTRCAGPHHTSWKNKNQSVWLRKRDREREGEREKKGRVIDRMGREKRERKRGTKQQAHRGQMYSALGNIGLPKTQLKINKAQGHDFKIVY